MRRIKERYYKREDGQMVKDERRNSGESMNVNVKNIALVVSLATAIASPFIALGGYTTRIENLEKKAEAQETKNRNFWENMSNTNTTVVRHEALIPVVQQDVRDLKGDVGEIKRDIKDILKEVKK